MGKNELLIAAEHTLSAALQAGQVYLEKYWAQLREHSLKNDVKPRDPNEIFADLKTRFFASEKQLLQPTLTRSPFAMER